MTPLRRALLVIAPAPDLTRVAAVRDDAIQSDLTAIRGA